MIVWVEYGATDDDDPFVDGVYMNLQAVVERMGGEIPDQTEVSGNIIHWKGRLFVCRVLEGFD